MLRLIVRRVPNGLSAGLARSAAALMAAPGAALVEQERPQRIAQASFVHFLSSHSFVEL